MFETWMRAIEDTLNLMKDGNDIDLLDLISENELNEMYMDGVDPSSALVYILHGYREAS